MDLEINYCVVISEEMATKEFDGKFLDLSSEAVSLALEYVDYSEEIECIYIYISLELGGMYLVFFKINGKISFKSDLNDHSLRRYDTSSENQGWLNAEGNSLAEEIRQCFIDDDREVPKYLKMTYEPKSQKEKFHCKMGYESLLNMDDPDSLVSELTIHFRWFAEEGGKLEPWQQAVADVK